MGLLNVVKGMVQKATVAAGLGLLKRAQLMGETGKIDNTIRLLIETQDLVDQANKIDKMSYKQISRKIGQMEYEVEQQSLRENPGEISVLKDASKMSRRERNEYFEKLGVQTAGTRLAMDPDYENLTSQQGAAKFLKAQIALTEKKSLNRLLQEMAQGQALQEAIDAQISREAISTPDILVATNIKNDSLDFPEDVAPIIDIDRLSDLGYSIKKMVEPSDEIMDLAQRIVQGIEGDPNVNQLSVETIADELAQLDDRAIQDFYRDNQELAEGYYHLGVNDFNPSVEETVALIRQYA